MKRYLLELDDDAVATLNKVHNEDEAPVYEVSITAKDVSLTMLPKGKLLTQDDVEKARKLGEKEAWELAQKLLEEEDNGGYSVGDLTDIFGVNTKLGPYCTDIVKDHTFHEVVALIQKWEEKKEAEAKAFHVGDVVKVSASKFYPERIAVITCVRNEYCAFVCEDGTVGSERKVFLTKTGKTIDIATQLEVMKGMTK